MGDVPGFYREQFRSFTCGTAHRPFPTGSLPGDIFQPTCSKDGRNGVAECRNNRRKGNHTKSHRRERPMCRSAALRISPVWTNRTTYRHVIPSENAVSRGIFPSSRFYLAPVLHPTWWIPPLRLRCGRNDRRFWFGCCGYKCTTTPALRAGWRQIAAATVGVPYFG